ncbi:MAG: hypothetical protein ACI9AT_001244 [Ulvibacter sp.]|jgi:hypothetical protein
MHWFSISSELKIIQIRNTIFHYQIGITHDLRDNHNQHP